MNFALEQAGAFKKAFRSRHARKYCDLDCRVLIPMLRRCTPVRHGSGHNAKTKLFHRAQGCRHDKRNKGNHHHGGPDGNQKRFLDHVLAPFAGCQATQAIKKQDRRGLSGASSASPLSDPLTAARPRAWSDEAPECVGRVISSNRIPWISIKAFNEGSNNFAKTRHIAGGAAH